MNEEELTISKRAENLFQTIIWLPILFVAGILFGTVYHPYEHWFLPESKRYKKLKHLRVPELAKEIKENNDFETADGDKWRGTIRTGVIHKNGLYEHEVRQIAKHLSYAATDYSYINDTLSVADNTSFWISRNGFEVAYAQKNLFFAFWLGVIITSSIFYFFII